MYGRVELGCDLGGGLSGGRRAGGFDNLKAAGSAWFTRRRRRADDLQKREVLFNSERASRASVREELKRRRGQTNPSLPHTVSEQT